MKFLAQNVNFNRLSFDFVCSRSSPYGDQRFGVFFSKRIITLLHVVFKTDSPCGSTDAVARHVSIDEITFKRLRYSSMAPRHSCLIAVRSYNAPSHNHS